MIQGIIFDFNNTLFDAKTGNLYSGTREVLARLAPEFVLGLISYGGDERRQLIRDLDLEPFFSFVRVVEEKTKDVFDEFINSFPFRHEEIIVVGDGYDSEIEIGSKLGMVTVLISNDRKSQFPNARFIVPEVFAIESVLIQLKV
jgi:FMN phosphatase YigB (HAD superfamily)